MSGVPLKLIVGLGNPGEEYARTRHNVGFWFVDELARRHGGAFRFESRHQAELARSHIGGAEVWLAKPLTYMNRSGEAAGSIARFYKATADEILIAYDDLDFPPGTARLKQGGGHAGHNGMRDILAHLDEAVWRLRLGIGRPTAQSAGTDRVLGRPSATDERLIREAIAAAADATVVLIERGAGAAMQQLHAGNEPTLPESKA